MPYVKLLNRYHYYRYTTESKKKNVHYLQSSKILNVAYKHKSTWMMGIRIYFFHLAVVLHVCCCKITSEDLFSIQATIDFLLHIHICIFCSIYLYTFFSFLNREPGWNFFHIASTLVPMVYYNKQLITMKWTKSYTTGPQTVLSSSKCPVCNYGLCGSRCSLQNDIGYSAYIST